MLYWVTLNKNTIMKNYRILFFILLLLWFLVNLIQAIYTEIISDEAYYGLYGKYLAWGYFDHPPMIALMTRISSLLFTGNLGIRFMTVVLEPLTLLFIWKIIDEPHPDTHKIYSFFIIAGSVCLFSILGFYTTPDAPLLFFTAFFLYSYKSYLANQRWKDVLLLALSMSGLVYSKYQAVLVIGFVVISNIKLLKSCKFWIAGFSAIILFTPHLLWQASNNYPSIKFHLIERSEGFNLHNVLEYLPNLLAVYNPFILGTVIYLMAKNRPKDQFSRGLYYLIAGFIVFFGLAAFHDHVEPQWTAASSLAMIILLYQNSIVNLKIYNFIRTTVLPTLIIIFIARILLISDIPLGRYLGLSGKRERFQFIYSVAKDLPVLFTGSFQNPSLYSFFNGREGIAINNLYCRKTEFDIWQFEIKYNNKPVFVCFSGEGRSTLYEKEGIRFYGYATDSLQTVNRIGVKIIPRPGILSSGDSLSLSVIFKSPYPYDINFDHNNFPVTICAVFIDRESVNLYPVILKDPVGIIKSGKTITRAVKVVVPELPAGKYHFGICLQTILGPSINDSFSLIKIVK
jgi:hypothetical protein